MKPSCGWNQWTRFLFFLFFLSLSFLGDAHEEGQTAEDLIRTGDRALAEGRWGDAVVPYEQFLKDFASTAPPLLDRIRIALARCYVSKGDFASALPAIEKALERNSDSTKSKHQLLKEKWNLLLWKSIAQLETGAPQKAVESFDDLLKLSWENPSLGKKDQRNEIILLRARALIQSGKTREAAHWLKEQSTAEVSDNYKTQIQLLRIEAFIAGREYPTALDTLLQISLPFGKTIKFQLLTVTLAQNLIKQGQLLLALQALSKTLPEGEVLKNNSYTEKVSVHERGESLVHQHEHSRALKAFEQFKNWDDSILLMRANAFFDLQRYRETALALEALQNPSIEEYITMLRCWLLAECPKRCLSIKQKWESQFCQSPKWALVQLLEGTAFLMLEDYEAALRSFHSIQSGEFVESARVQEIKTLLLAHKEEEALHVISAFTYPNSSALEEVLYLRGVALSNREEYDACRESMSDLLRRFPKGERAAAAHFLRANAAHCKMDFSTAITELRQTLQKFPGSPNEAEAWLLLGDALLDQQKIEEALVAYRKVPCSSLGFHEIAVFRTGKIFKKLGKLNELKKEMECFQQDHPESSRLAEAIREIGWVYQELKQLHLINDLYWKTVEQQGALPNAHAVETLLQDLQKRYAAEAKLEDYQQRLVQLRNQALDKPVLVFRLIWAQSQLLENPLQKAQFISAFIKEDHIQHASPRILSDFADTLFKAKFFQQAAPLYQYVLKWHPAASERDRSLAGLAHLAHEEGDSKKSLFYWNQLLEQTPESRFVPEAELAKTRVLMDTQQTEAILGFNKVIGHDLASCTQKVEALYWLGEMHMKQGQPQLAVPYFQRIYIAYGAEKKWVAQAYLRSARAFELLGDLSSMQRTYEEIISREDLKEFPEFNQAKKKLASFSH